MQPPIGVPCRVNRRKRHAQVVVRLSPHPATFGVNSCAPCGSFVIRSYFRGKPATDDSLPHCASCQLRIHHDERRSCAAPRHPRQQIVFTYAGDLYTVAATGGAARRLTSHDGFEMFARFSPDGKRLAFTGQYDGNTEVYVMPAEGGAPKRLTFTATLGRDDVSDRMGPNNIVMGWKHGRQAHRLPLAHALVQRLPRPALHGQRQRRLARSSCRCPRGGFCSFSPDGKKLAYNRVFREFRTWKRYRGGMADDVWIYDFKTHKTTNITNNPALDIIPMWNGDKIYFLSDRDENKRMNLYVYDLATHETKKLTDFTDFDIKFPSLGDKAIVFENGGYIYRFDLATEKAEKVPIRFAEDHRRGRAGSSSTSARTSPTSRFRPTASARCSAPAATCSPCPPRTARRAT